MTGWSRNTVLGSRQSGVIVTRRSAVIQRYCLVVRCLNRTCCSQRMTSPATEWTLNRDMTKRFNSVKLYHLKHWPPPQFANRYLQTLKGTGTSVWADPQVVYANVLQNTLNERFFSMKTIIKTPHFLINTVFGDFIIKQTLRYHIRFHFFMKKPDSWAALV